MLTVKLKMSDNIIRDLRVLEVIEIDGRPYQEQLLPDANNQEIRIRQLEQHVFALMNFIDDLSPPGRHNPDSVSSSQDEP